MTPVETVRAMLAQHERKHGIDPQGAPFPRRGDTAVHAAYHDALRDVMAALEQADTAPRLEWEVRSGYGGDCVPQFMYASNGAYEAEVRTGVVGVWWKSICWYCVSFAGDAERGQRIAELVIHRHRQMLDEIARVK